MASIAARSDFKDRVINYKMRLFTSDRSMPDPKQVGVYVLTRVIPAMETNGEVAFFWNGSDVIAQTQEHYDKSIALKEFKREFPKMDRGDTEWEFVFSKGGKKRRCVMTTEIHYHPNKQQPISPFALLFGQMFAQGLHITKCRFEDAE